MRDVYFWFSLAGWLAATAVICLLAWRHLRKGRD